MNNQSLKHIPFPYPDETHLYKIEKRLESFGLTLADCSDSELRQMNFELEMDEMKQRGKCPPYHFLDGMLNDMYLQEKKYNRK